MKIIIMRFYRDCVLIEESYNESSTTKNPILCIRYELTAVDAVATANILTVIGDALLKTRVSLLGYGINLARFAYQ